MRKLYRFFYVIFLSQDMSTYALHLPSFLYFSATPHWQFFFLAQLFQIL